MIRRNKITVFSVLYEFAVPAYVGGNYRKSCCHGFNDAAGKALRSGGNTKQSLRLKRAGISFRCPSILTFGSNPFLDDLPVYILPAGAIADNE